MPQFLQRRFEGPRVRRPFDHLAVLAGDGGEDTHTYVHSDPRLRVTRTGLDGALDENPESGHQPGPAAGDSRGEDAGSAFGDQPLQAAGVLGLTRAFDRALAPDPVPDTPGMA